MIPYGWTDGNTLAFQKTGISEINTGTSVQVTINSSSGRYLLNVNWMQWNTQSLRKVSAVSTPILEELDNEAEVEEIEEY